MREDSDSPRAGEPGRRFGLPLAACALVALNLAAWCAVAYAYGLSPLATQNSALLLRAGAADAQLLGAGEWWRVLTSQFLHVHFPHMLFNVGAVLLLGGALEREFGARRLLALYLPGGTLGQLAGVAAAPSLVSSGASQALMALAGGGAVRLTRRPRRASLAVTLAAVVAVQVALDLLAAGQVKAGHLAGFCAGVVLGYLLLRPRARALPD